MIAQKHGSFQTGWMHPSSLGRGRACFHYGKHFLSCHIWSPDHLLWATFSKDFSQTEKLSSCFSHGILNIFLLCHIYTVFHWMLAISSIKCELLRVCIFLIFIFPEPSRGGSSCLRKWVKKWGTECFPLTKACFYFKILSFVNVYHIYLTLGLFFNT